MSRQAIVGLFSLIGLAAAFVVVYVLNDLGTRANGYRIGVHYTTASGLRTGAIVYLSGVSVGSVTAINLLPDYTVDVIMGIRADRDIPKGSKFIIQAPLTGDPTLLIVPPRITPGEQPEMLPHEIQPLADQPRGHNPAGVADLLEGGQDQLRHLDRLLGELERREPRLLATLQATLDHSNELTINANRSLDTISQQAEVITASLQRSLAVATNNIDDMTGTLNGTIVRNSGKIDQLLTSLNATSASLASTVDSLHGIAATPELKQNVLRTTRALALTTQTLSELTGDLRKVTGNPSTQSHLRDAAAQIDAATQRMTSLLGQLGGKSDVPGVDAGAAATPSGTDAPASATPGPDAPASGPPSAGARTHAPPAALGGLNFRSRLSAMTSNLVAVQVRVSSLSPVHGTSPGGSPLLSRDQGPQSDFNAVFLPNSSKSIMVGGNDIGGAAPTVNVLQLDRLGFARVGYGVLYSRLGLLGQFGGSRGLGSELRLYDARDMTLDAYGTLRPIAGPLELFAGERDTLKNDRRTVFGLQYQF